MKISIFPEVTPHPRSKEEKVANSKYASKPHLPKTVYPETDEQLISYITSYAWSPSVFTGYRNNDNFISTDFMVLDIDSGLSLNSAEKRCENLRLCHLILPSPSYSPENEKYRLIFPLVETISNREVFDLTWDYLYSLFPEIDKQCSDYARFYFASRQANGVWGDGDFLMPIKPVQKPVKFEYDYSQSFVPVEGYDDLSILEKLYGAVPENIPQRVDHFLKLAHTGLPGEWIVSLNHCCFTLALQGVKEEIIWDVVESLAPEELDKRDKSTAGKAIKDGAKARQDE